jgi:uncharacterized CHY-type Zn-finger protein
MEKIQVNIYDTKPITCSRCQKYIGEVEYDSKVIQPLCGICSNMFPINEQIDYEMNNYQPMQKLVANASITS